MKARKRKSPLSVWAVSLAAAPLFLSCARADRRAAGRLVSVGSHRLEMRLEGRGSPVVVLDAGLADAMDRMAALRERLAGRTSVVAYNRAGYGRSDPGPAPRRAGREAEELKALLDKASIPGPYVLVGHSLGALNMMMFASLYPGDSAGMVLLDPPPLAFILGRAYPELRAMAGRMTAEWQTAAETAARSGDPGEKARAAFFAAIASEHREMFGETAHEVGAIATFNDLPLIVCAAGRAKPAFGAVAAEYQKYWIEQSRSLASKSAHGRFVLAENSGHYLYQDVPDLVVQEILSLVESVRAASPDIRTRELRLRCLEMAGGAAASVIADCARAMGGEAGIKRIRTLRAEVVYPDHDASPVRHEIRRPNIIRTERAGAYVSLFDGRNGAMLKYDPAKPGQPPVPEPLPAEAARGFETDLVWFFPAFFDFPAECAGEAESGGVKCHKLIVTLPLGTRAEYFIDARTSLIRRIVVEENFQGRTFRMEREWLDLKPVEGILFPTRMTYPGRGGKTATAEIQSLEINPVLGDDLFKVPETAR